MQADTTLAVRAHASGPALATEASSHARTKRGRRQCQTRVAGATGTSVVARVSACLVTAAGGSGQQHGDSGRPGQHGGTRAGVRARTRRANQRSVPSRGNGDRVQHRNYVVQTF